MRIAQLDEGMEISFSPVSGVRGFQTLPSETDFSQQADQDKTPEADAVIQNADRPKDLYHDKLNQI